jgi:large subunit ribosomal protein L34
LLTGLQFFAVIVGFPNCWWRDARLAERKRREHRKRALPRAALPADFLNFSSSGPPKARQEIVTMKRTYQPSKIRRARTHGFLVRMKSRGGRAVINARRAKGRKRLAV